VRPERGAGNHRRVSAALLLTPAFKPVHHEQLRRSRLNGFYIARRLTGLNAGVNESQLGL
jgi:hypothetical protein